MVLNFSKQPWITVTAKAAENIHFLMEEQELDYQYLRLLGERSGCSGFKYGLTFSKEPRCGDTIIYSNGIRILVDTYSLILLQGMTIDFVESPEGSNFSIDNPNETPGAERIRCSGKCNGSTIFQQQIPVQKQDIPNLQIHREQIGRPKDMLTISSEFQSRTIMINRLPG